MQPCEFRQWIDMRKITPAELRIDAKEGTSLYFQQMEAFREKRATKRREAEMHLRIKDMHNHMRETELKEEEEQLREREEAIKKREEDLKLREEQLQKRQKKRTMAFRSTQ